MNITILDENIITMVLLVGTGILQLYGFIKENQKLKKKIKRIEKLEEEK